MSGSIDDLARYIRSQRERYDRALASDLARLRTEYGERVVGEALREALAPAERRSRPRSGHGVITRKWASG